MSLRIIHAATAALILTSIAACGGGEENGNGGGTSRNPASKVSIAVAMKSDAAATTACRTLIGNGATQADWLSDVSPSGTTVKGEPTSYGFRCTVEDKDDQYAGFSFVQTKEKLDYEVKDALHSTSTPDQVASAWNAETQAGVYSQSVTEDRNQTATQDMQAIVNQVGQ